MLSKYQMSLNNCASPLNGARGIIFGLGLYHHPYFVNMSIKGSKEIAHLRLRYARVPKSHVLAKFVLLLLQSYIYIKIPFL